jgi:DNA adenine methylase
MESPIKWVGGKRKEIKNFEKYIPKFNTYIEPFVGGGALYWYLEPENAVINDINEHLINFYKVLRDNHSILSCELKKYINSKEFFNEIVKKLNNKDYKNNIEQAEIFYYLNKTCFSGKWRTNSKGEFNNTFGNYKSDNYKSLDNCYVKLLQTTKIYNKDYKEILEKYKNDENAFIFLDPPYLDCDTMYTDNQEFEDVYMYIGSYIKNCKCKVMLVVKENNYINSIFKNNTIDKYEINYRHNALSEKKHNHIVITNYNTQDIVYMAI